MNEFIAESENDVDDGGGGDVVALVALDFGDSNVASCYGHCWKNCRGCLV